MPVDLTPIFTCCALPLLILVIALAIAFARWTSPEGQERIMRRSEELGRRARERALNEKRRGFEVKEPPKEGRHDES